MRFPKRWQTYRFNPFTNLWEYYNSTGFGYWVKSIYYNQITTGYKPSKNYTLKYKDTWCEPYEGMED